MNKPIRIIYCTSGGLYGRLVLERLMQEPRIAVVGVVLSTRVLSRRLGWMRGAWRQIRLSGLRYALYLWVATGFHDILSGPSRVTRLAAAQAIPILATRDINGEAETAFVKRANADVLLSGFFNQRLGEEVCRLPRLGCVNIHPGRLPDYRGVDPVFHALLAGETRLGVSLHRVTEAFDEGPLLASDAVEGGDGASVLSLTACLFCRGCRLFIDALPDLLEGRNGIPQSGAGRYDSWPDAGAVDRLRERGQPLLRWQDTSLLRQRRQCDHWVRA